MFSTDYSLAKALMELKVNEALRGAEHRCLLLAAGHTRKTWLSRYGGWLLDRLGSALVILGRRLQQAGTAQSLSLGSAPLGHPE